MVEVAIEHFYRDVNSGVWSVSESAELIARCRVGRLGGGVQLDKQFTAKSPFQKTRIMPLAQETGERVKKAQAKGGV